MITPQQWLNNVHQKELEMKSAAEEAKKADLIKVRDSVIAALEAGEYSYTNFGLHHYDSLVEATNMLREWGFCARFIYECDLLGMQRVEWRTNKPSWFARTFGGWK